MTIINRSRLKTCLLAHPFRQLSPLKKIFLGASLCLLLVAISGFRTIGVPLVLTTADNGTTVSVSSGKQVIIQLPDNSGSTGYSWKFTTPSSQILILQSTTHTPAAHSPHLMLGAPGTVVFTFLAQNSGSIRLHFQLQRPWEVAVPPAQRFTVTVQVQPVNQHQFPPYHP